MSLEVAIESLLNQAHQETSTETTIVRNVGNPRAKKETFFKATEVKAKTGEAIFGLSFPETRPFSLQSCQTFMRDMLNAGRRQNEGRAFTDPREVRNDSIQAIAAFMGYDPNQSFATQEQAARSLASRTLSGRKIIAETRQETRQALSSALEKGLARITTPGHPDYHSKRLASLRGNEVALVESILAWEKVAKDASQTLTVRAEAKGKAQLETARLEHVRKDIDAINGGARYLRAIE